MSWACRLAQYPDTADARSPVYSQSNGAQNLTAAPLTVTLRLGGSAKAGPVLTDNGNFVLDVVFPSS